MRLLDYVLEASSHVTRLLFIYRALAAPTLKTTPFPFDQSSGSTVRASRYVINIHEPGLQRSSAWSRIPDPAPRRTAECPRAGEECAGVPAGHEQRSWWRWENKHINTCIKLTSAASVLLLCPRIYHWNIWEMRATPNSRKRSLITYMWDHYSHYFQNVFTIWSL